MIKTQKNKFMKTKNPKTFFCTAYQLNKKTVVTCIMKCVHEAHLQSKTDPPFINIFVVENTVSKCIYSFTLSMEYFSLLCIYLGKHVQYR